MKEGWRIADTVTNAAYLFAGLTAFGAGAHTFGAALVVLSVGSAAFHWTREDKDRAADEIGMYAALVALIGLLAGLPPYITYGAAALLAAFRGRLPSFWVVGILAAIAFVLLALASLTTALVAAGLFLAALFVRNRYAWGHSVWHLISAGALTVPLVA